MTNTNCLEGIQCPACGNEDRFRIAGKAFFTVTDDGTDDYGDVEWDDDSDAECAECHRHRHPEGFQGETLTSPARSGRHELRPGRMGR